MNTILTDDERREILDSFPLHPWGIGSTRRDAELIVVKTEAAVLAKLREQEPVAYGMPDTQLGRKHRLMMVRLDKGQDGCTLPLYAAPQPAVVQVPQRMVVTEAMHVAACKVLTRASGMDGLPQRMLDAMLATAPEAPAQGDALQQALDSLSFYKRRWNALHKAQVRMRDPERVMVCDILANGMLLEPPGNRYEAPVQAIPAPWREAVKVAREATEEDAYEMGAKGAPATEQERKLFEAWMRGHCWALCAHWNGSGYVSDAEQGGNLDPRAMVTRQLWAAWRDRAALAQLDALEGGE